MYKYLQNTKGSMTMFGIVALAIVGVVMSLVFEQSKLHYEKQRLQMVADAIALAGAHELDGAAGSWHDAKRAAIMANRVNLVKNNPFRHNVEHGYVGSEPGVHVSTGIFTSYNELSKDITEKFIDISTPSVSIDYKKYWRNRYDIPESATDSRVRLIARFYRGIYASFDGDKYSFRSLEGFTDQDNLNSFIMQNPDYGGMRMAFIPKIGDPDYRDGSTMTEDLSGACSHRGARMIDMGTLFEQVQLKDDTSDNCTVEKASNAMLVDLQFLSKSIFDGFLGIPSARWISARSVSARDDYRQHGKPVASYDPVSQIATPIDTNIPAYEPIPTNYALSY